MKKDFRDNDRITVGVNEIAYLLFKGHHIIFRNTGDLSRLIFYTDKQFSACIVGTGYNDFGTVGNRWE